MANLINIESTDGLNIVNTNAKVNYDAIQGIPSELIDPNNHNHDDLYKSKFAIEDNFTAIMNKVQAMTKALTIRPLKTKGFLNGGYKSSYVYAQRVQRFNTVTETGVEIGQIGSVTSQYSPGGSAELCGYYFGDTTSSTERGDHSATGRHVDKIVYLTEVETYLGNITHHNTRTTLYNIYSQSRLYLANAGEGWSELSVVTDAVTLKSSTLAGKGMGRQGLSSESFGYVVDRGNAERTSLKFIYLTTVTETGTTQTIRQQPAGLSKDADLGYWIDYGTANNWRVDMVANTVSNVVCFTEGFGESNALGSEKVGFMMGGYDGAQHGKVQKMDWATESASNVLGGSLAIPQSSAGMAEA
jgi:hypothetical protein